MSARRPPNRRWWRSILTAVPLAASLWGCGDDPKKPATNDGSAGDGASGESGGTGESGAGGTGATGGTSRGGSSGKGSGGSAAGAEARGGEGGDDGTGGSNPEGGTGGSSRGGTSGDAGAGGDDGEPPLVPPPDPSTIAPVLGKDSATSFWDANAFLFEADPPVQTLVEPGALVEERMAIVRGRVTDLDGAPLAGVRVRIQGEPELGRTGTREDGAFDLAVNGGGTVTLSFDKPGYPNAFRHVGTKWQDFSVVPDIAMVAYDVNANAVDLSDDTPQIAQGSVIDDGDGVRQATLLFPAGTGATLELPDGSSQALSTLTVRATEYTVGENGEAAMPAPLPPTTGYTYAVEFSVDEAVEAGATSVSFDRPVMSYTDNFLEFPAGNIVPAGYFDPKRGAWVPSENGLVIDVLDVVGGSATLDVDGSGLPADSDALAALGVDDAELASIGSIYAAGDSFWRVPVTHFSAWDFNWGIGPQEGSTPPKQKTPKNTAGTDDDPCNHAGSIIECQNQVLGESIPVAGTPFSLNYRSQRVPGRVKGLEIPLSDATLPDEVKSIELEVSVAGRTFLESFAPERNLSTLFVWDGNDAYGRSLQGRHFATLRVGYTYDAVYLEASDMPGVDYERLFGHFTYYGTPVTGDRARREITLWQDHSASLEPVGAWDARGSGLGGWSLDVHHGYDPRSGSLYLGNGDQRTARDANHAVTLYSPEPDGDVYEATFLPDGAILAVVEGSVQRIARDGTTRVVAGIAGQRNETSGDGGPAVGAGMQARELALSADGTVYLTDTQELIRRVDPNGTIHAFAGQRQTSPYVSSGDGGPATSAKFQTNSIALGPDGSLYLADFAPITNDSCRIRRIDADGIIRTIAGNGTSGWPSEGALAAQSPLGFSCEIDVDKQGRVYVLSKQEVVPNFPGRLHRVDTDGTIHLVAGNGTITGTGNGGLATQAALDYAYVALGPDDSVYIGGITDVRRIDSDGTIWSVAGTPTPQPTGGWCDYRLLGSHPMAFNTCSPQVRFGPDGGFHFFEWRSGAFYKVGASLPAFASTDLAIASEDGQRLYRFDGSGKHLATVSPMTGAEFVRFGYAPNGALASVTDADGNTTAIERSQAGAPTAIVGPFGHRTELQLDENGYLSRLTDPSGRVTELQSTAGGLITTLTDPKGGLHEFSYDPLGRLLSDESPGATTTLARTDGTSDYTVTATSALGRVRSYQVADVVAGVRMVNRSTANTAATTDVTRAGDVTITAADGTVRTIVQKPDPRFLTHSPLLASASIRLPSGLTRSATYQRSVVLGDPGDRLSLDTLTDTATINTRVFTSVYDAAEQTQTRTSAAGRQQITTFDELERPTEFHMSTFDPTLTTYDEHGRVATFSTGFRSFSFEYGSDGMMETVTLPGGAVTHFAYDASGGIAEQQLPSGDTISFTHDDNRNLTSVTPPGRPAHTFAYSSANLVISYSPPAVAAETAEVLYEYDADSQLTQLTRADGRSVVVGYDSAGRVASHTTAEGSHTFAYDSAGRPSTLTAPGNVGLTATYDGMLVRSLQATGPVAGTVTFGYDADFRTTSVGVNGSNLTLAYDADGLLTQAGTLSLTRDAATGLVTNTALGSSTDYYGYDSVGELGSFAAYYGSTTLYNLSLGTSEAGQVTDRFETIDGVTTTSTYTYDAAGRLLTASVNDVLTATYTYDANGNRLSVDRSGAVTSGTYDARDRLVAYGAATLSYSADGELTSVAAPSGTTSYSYDSSGVLLGVTLPAQQIDYVVDPLRRRVGKRVGGTLVQGFLYQDDLRPIAELDGTSAVVSRFVYASPRLAPDYMVRDGVTYRIVSDHLGSVRFVVDIDTGTVVQRLDYDEFGRILGDTNPGFQPFGFAGGLYDADTGLVLFGARSYDPNLGRFTSRDPSLFSGASANLYTYSNNDPVGSLDPTGLFGVSFSGYFVVGAGAKLAVNGDGFSVCVEGGLGIGGGLGVDAFGGLDPDGVITKAEAELSIGGGPISAGVKASAGVNSGGCGEAKVQVKLGPIKHDLVQAGSMPSGSDGAKVHTTVPKLELGGGVKAGAKAVAQRCWQAPW